MKPPTLCMICERIGGQASIGKIARQEVEAALAAGWQVTVAANALDSALQREVEWLRLYVPPRSFAFQWLTGRHWIKKALGKRTLDVVHGHQPQIADLTDVYQCHFLTLIYASPAERFATGGERVAARTRWLGGSRQRIVAGFLGGLVERKGYRHILRALAGAKDVFLLMGGPNSGGFQAPEFGGNMRSIGVCDDTDSFYAACDVLLVPSLFEPFGLVVSEAVARGVPVIATDGVGALPHLLEHGAGARWDLLKPLAPIIRSLAASSTQFRDGCARYTRAYSAAQHDRILLGFYQEAKARKLRDGASRT